MKLVWLVQKTEKKDTDIAQKIKNKRRGKWRLHQSDKEKYILYVHYYNILLNFQPQI